ncbi:MAG TPA: ATP-binding protein [Candidatus Krumholzibacteria bacterium]|nr:ATP-binding protein [Candidatus Krumholzibacteria bacterium]
MANELGELRRINRALIEFLGEEGVPPDGVNRVRLVVEELVVNIIMHAFEDAAAHTIVLSLRTAPGSVTVTTEDDGKPFDPREAPPAPVGRPLEEQGAGGYGIYIVTHMARSLDYERVDGRNRVRAVIEYKTGRA